ncbi:putative Histidine kinase [Magnetospirillum sp. LM-5]|uniref:sensor histidine kinase n=1 Tax=Magnetospirillum sp. LM-5 TaxID=2681466 RepID=UPI00137E1694|nr:ATP-binding protein [Magnetospirillum sp. LM-5]CAA7621175.1 putative Histidine kinase [Magnetospirillum sp. LM-5]
MVRLVHHQLTMAMVAAVTMALAYGGAIVVSDYTARRDSLQSQIEQIAQDHQKAAEDFIAGYRLVLIAIAETDCVKTRDGTSCGALFARLNQRFPAAVNFAATDSAGIFVASGKPFPGGKPTNISQAPFFINLATKGSLFEVMDPHTGPVSGQVVTGLAIPLRDTSGQFSGILGLSLEFAELDDRWRQLPGPKDMPALVFDRAGRLIHSSPAAAAVPALPRDASPAFVDSLSSASGLATLAGRQWQYHRETIASAGWTVLAMHPAPYGILEYLHDTPLLFQLLPPAVVLALVGLWLAAREFRHLVGLEHAVESRTRELSEANMRLARSAQELETLTWVASHDLREPSRAVATYVSMLERRYGGQLDDDGRAFIGFARDGAKRMNELVLALLDYTRISRIDDPLGQIRPEQTINRVVGDLAPLVEGLHAEITIDHPLPVLNIRDGHLDILFRQMIENALRHHHPDRRPSIHIGCDGTGPDAEFWVCDNGKGIAPEYREKVFTMFQRLDPLSVPEGTGIGLTLCTRVIDHYGGRVHISDSPQGGCCFRFTLPLAARKQAVS